MRQRYAVDIDATPFTAIIFALSLMLAQARRRHDAPAPLRCYCRRRFDAMMRALRHYARYRRTETALLMPLCRQGLMFTLFIALPALDAGWRYRLYIRCGGVRRFMTRDAPDEAMRCLLECRLMLHAASLLLFDATPLRHGAIIYAALPRQR